MFYDTDYGLWYMVVFWTMVTLVFGVSLHLALKMASIELEYLEQVVVVLISSLTALVPVVGPYLAFVIAIFLIYRMADTSLLMVIGAVMITRFMAMLVALVLLKALIAAGIINK